MMNLKNKWMLLVMLFAVISCKKNDLDTLGGDTDLELTKVNKETSVYIKGSGVSFPEVIAKIITNNNGDVTYRILVDFTGHPDSAVLVPLIPASMKDAQNRVQYDVKLRITSEGIQDYENANGKPFTIVKYDAKVGDAYSITDDNGKKLTRSVTERTDDNDWPYSLYYIKTIKIEQNDFNSTWDPIVEKVTYRANHKFGLVYIEAVLKNGKVLKADLFPWYML